MQVPTISRAPFGNSALFLGALALTAAMVCVYAGPFAPQQKIGVSLGEIAADMAKSAFRGLNGQAQPAPVAGGMNIDDLLQIAVSVTGVLAIVLSVVALARHEPWRLCAGALGLGLGAVFFQFVAWAVMLIAGVALLVAVIMNIGSILTSFAG
jgi:hypothetical protein